MAKRRLWRLSAKVLGKLGEQRDEGELYVSAADCSQNLYRLAPPDVRTKRLRAIVLAVSNRGVTGQATREQRVQMIKGETGLGGLISHDSLEAGSKHASMP